MSHSHKITIGHWGRGRRFRNEGGMHAQMGLLLKCYGKTNGMIVFREQSKFRVSRFSFKF